MRVLLDVDGVLADLVGALAEACHFRHEDVTTYNFADCLPTATYREIERLMAAPGFVEELPECRGARDLFAALTAAGHQPVFVTKPYHKSPTWAYERQRWLEKTFGSNLQVVHTASKELVQGDAIVEDSAENIRTWIKENPKGWAFLIDRPWNRSRLALERVTRAYALTEIPRLLGQA